MRLPEITPEIGFTKQCLLLEVKLIMTETLLSLVGYHMQYNSHSLRSDPGIRTMKLSPYVSSPFVVK